MTISTTERTASGIRSLDEILHGGFLPGRTYLISGEPGTGKTIFGLHFTLATHSRALLVSFNQTEEHLREDAASLDIDTRDVAFLDLTPDPELFSQAHSYDIFSASEIEREPITQLIRTKIEEISPDRIFMDGFSQLRTVSTDTFHFLRIAQSLFRFATARGATVLVSGIDAMADVDRVLQASADGVIRLERHGQSRSLEVIKMRGSPFSAGAHPMRITAAGLEVLADSV